MKRRNLVRNTSLGAIAATGLAAPAIAQAMPEIKWRMTSSFPKSLDTIYGAGGNEELMRAIRSHANTVEFLPMFVILSLCYELYAGANWALATLVGLFLLGRLSFAIGMALAPVHLLRRVGAGLSYLTLLLLSLLLLAAVITSF